MEHILALNPGATSTKIGIFDGDQVILKKTVAHSDEDLQRFTDVYEQLDYRQELILAALKEAGISVDTLQAVVGRGGLLKPMTGGTYLVNDLLLHDLQHKVRQTHASNLGGMLAKRIADPVGIPAYIVDPVSVDELDPVARITGWPEFERVSLLHALNMRAVARLTAAEMDMEYEDIQIIVVHLGTGISLSAHKGGRMIDMSEGREEGAFSADRCGSLPNMQLIDACFSGNRTKEQMKKDFFGNGGLFAYLGTRDIREVERRMDEGDEKAALVHNALCYQVSKEIGALATVLYGEVERIVLTGGMAHSPKITENIRKRVQFIAPVTIMPGEEELEALAAGALRILRKEETARIYS